MFLFKSWFCTVRLIMCCEVLFYSFLLADIIFKLYYHLSAADSELIICFRVFSSLSLIILKYQICLQKCWCFWLFFPKLWGKQKKIKNNQVEQNGNIQLSSCKIKSHWVKMSLKLRFNNQIAGGQSEMKRKFIPHVKWFRLRVPIRRWAAAFWTSYRREREAWQVPIYKALQQSSCVVINACIILSKSEG